MFTYAVLHDPFTGVTLGVLRSDGLFVPADAGNADWRAFLVWNAALASPLSLANLPAPTPYAPRTLAAIFADLSALTATQQANAAADLFGGTPAKLLLDAGPNAAALWVLASLVQDLGLTGTALTKAKLRAAAAYVQDNPLYLVNPAFDPTINVPGRTAVSS